MAQILEYVHQIICYLVGGTYGTGADAVTITAANSWVGKLAGAIVDNPIILIFVIVGLVFLGLNAVRKLMRV